MNHSKSRRRRVGAAVAMAVAMALVGAGCSSDAGDGAEAGAVNLAYQFVGPPLAGLNPAKTGGTNSSAMFNVPAYSSLLFQRPDGSIVGDLATEWGYPEGDNLTFNVTLRDDAEFADGGAVDAAAVKKSLEYVRDGGFYLSPRFANFEDIQIVDDYELSIKLSAPVAALPFALTPAGGAGFIISPEGVDNPDMLDNATAGSGPYVYNPERSIIDTTYVFERNPNYYNPDAVKAETLTVQVITDPNTAVSALQTGQVSVVSGRATTAPAAEAAGMDVYAVGGSAHGIGIIDREGAVVPAFADVRVRQAINYAIDREALTEAMLPGGFGTPTEQILAEGQPGYNPDLVGRYAYNLDKAKSLLAEAGYADGFAFDLLCSETVGNCPAAEAAAGDLARVGITVTVEMVGVSTSAFDEKAASGQYGAAMQRLRTVASEFAPLLLPDAGGSSNPFESEDPEITRLWEEALAETDPDAQAELWSQMSERVAELAWFAPLYIAKFVYFVDPDLKGFKVTNENAIYSPFDVTGEYSWTK
ncbi:ABC transporter substrate-binding protein [Salinibacterium sp. GXW1014]|uniref:ABC transporter substrate-binding protein n=1 Tax=Salinibacterium sp. GXW1014 TaxID=3377838 RepID=UPI00383AE533